MSSNLYSFPKYSKTFRVIYYILRHREIYVLQLGNGYSKWLTTLVNKKEENYNSLGYIFSLAYKYHFTLKSLHWRNLKLSTPCKNPPFNFHLCETQLMYKTFLHIPFLSKAGNTEKVSILLPSLQKQEPKKNQAKKSRFYHF